MKRQLTSLSEKRKSREYSQPGESSSSGDDESESESEESYDAVLNIINEKAKNAKSNVQTNK